ncbi:hypothetical protein LCGC14_0769410 [marine sediment metagenome]|uniref:Uncharacterized protein n=1 Tax=marine sediment metagenome TaxID=412755 RepID=A0A0F9Q2Y6_9ZZZZ
MAFGQAIPAEIERRLKGLERQVAVLMREREQNRMTVSENVEIKVTEKVEETAPVKKTRKRRTAKKA